MTAILNPASLVGKTVVLTLASAPGMESMQVTGTVTEHVPADGVVRLAQAAVRFGAGRWQRTPRVNSRPIRVAAILTAEIR